MATLIGPPDLRNMTQRQRLAFLKDNGIHLYHAESMGGGNRDHRLWWVEFNGPGLANGYYRMQVSCAHTSGSVDGKAACGREAREHAVEMLLGLAQNRYA